MDALWSNPDILVGDKLKIQNDRLTMMRNMAALDKEKLENITKQNELWAAHGQTILNAPPDQQPAVYQQEMQKAQQEGLPGAADLIKQYPTFPGDALVRTQAMSHLTVKEMGEQAKELPAMTEAAMKVFANAAQGAAASKDPEAAYQALLKDPRIAPSYIQPLVPRTLLTNGSAQNSLATLQNFALTPKEQLEAPGTVATGEQKVRANVAGPLAAAQDQASYANLFYKQPKNIQDEIPVKPDQWDGDTTPRAIQKWGQTPEQQVATGITAQRLTAYQGRLEELERHNQVTENLSRIREARESGNTPKPADIRAAKADIAKLSDTEDKLQKQRGALEAALQDPKGTTYIDESGKGMSMSKALGQYGQGDNAAQQAQSLRDQMWSRYNSLTDSQQRVSRDKNDAAIGVGSQPSVTTDQIHNQLEKDRQRVQNYFKPGAAPTTTTPAAPAATPPPSTPPPAAKTPPQAPSKTVAPVLPPAAKAKLKQGVVTTFGNGQKWTLVNGKEQQVK
jgi:hypothetical protein